MPDSPERISAILCRLFDILYVEFGIKAKQLDVMDSDGQPSAVILPFPKKCFELRPEIVTLAASTDEPFPSITPTERRILKAIEMMNGESPTGEAIAAAAKLPYEANLRKMLVAMRTKGVLGGDKGDKGYPITTLGLELISLENQ